MNSYIQYIIEDLAEAEANPVDMPKWDEDEDFVQNMMKLEEGRVIPAKTLLNVSYEELPPAERLDKMQMQKLLIAIFNALAAKGTNVSIPGNRVPVEIVYTEIREKFKEGFFQMPGWTIDFCSGYCSDCAFKNYCEYAK